MNEKETAAETRAQFLRDAFEGIKGRQPMSDDELNQWLATDEGKAATVFDDTTLSPWGERGAILTTPTTSRYRGRANCAAPAMGRSCVVRFKKKIPPQQQ
jgi:hypothetical protein